MPSRDPRRPCPGPGGSFASNRRDFLSRSALGFGSMALASVLARHDVNVDAVFQAPWSGKSALPFVVTLEPVDEERLGRALVELAALPFHVETPLALPMTA